MWGNQRGHQWRYNIAYALWMLDKQGYTRFHMPNSPGTHPPKHIHAHAGTRAHTNRQILVRIPFSRQKIFAKAPQCCVLHTLPSLFYLFPYSFTLCLSSYVNINTALFYCLRNSFANLDIGQQASNLWPWKMASICTKFYTGCSACEMLWILCEIR
jgi:hypothetical protein